MYSIRNGVIPWQMYDFLSNCNIVTCAPSLTVCEIFAKKKEKCKKKLTLKMKVKVKEKENTTYASHSTRIAQIHIGEFSVF